MAARSSRRSRRHSAASPSPLAFRLQVAFGPRRPGASLRRGDSNNNKKTLGLAATDGQQGEAYRGSDHRGLCRHVARQCQNFAAARQSHRVDRRRIFLRRYRPDRAGIADPDMLADQVRTGPEAGWIGSATVLGMFIGAAGQGQFSDDGAARPSTSSTCCCSHLHHSRCVRADGMVARRRALHCRIGLGGEQPLAFAYAGEYSPRPSAAASWRSYTSSAAPASGRSPRCSRCSSAIRSAGRACGL